MIKYFSPFDFEGGDIVLLEGEHLVKVAQMEVVSEARRFIESLKPNENVFYCLVVALGAGEYWGANKNGDYFPERELVKSYKTFEDGHVFRLHDNKDPNKAIGKIIKAFWNDRMKRVELVIELDRKKAADILERLENGEPVDVSMGCKVDYDICSICGNRARSRSQYCEHLKYHMGEILEDGRQVFAINPNPTFFDLSFVRRGADPSAKVLMKVAQDKKEAQIEKELPAQQVVLVKDIPKISWGLLEASSPFPIRILDKLLAHPIEDIAITLGALGVPLKLSELEYLLSFMPPIPPRALERLMLRGRFCPAIAELVRDYLLERTFWNKEPVLLKHAQTHPTPEYEAYQRGMLKKLAQLDISGLGKAALIAALLALLVKFLKPMLSRSVMLETGIIGGAGLDPRWQQDIAGAFERGVQPFASIDTSALEQANMLGNYIMALQGPERVNKAIQSIIQKGV